ncbi:MAG: hypothetical protein LBP33_11875 [Candidatus Adiutrix sp.]|jgi:hypothetical protein|nr:hypothetical protein [Candidatus Adiutrix sp.]
MIKRVIPVLFLALIVSAAACADPLKQSGRKISPCLSPTTKLRIVPYPREDPNTCAVAVAPFDLGVWTEAPMNSHMIRGGKRIQLGCKPLSAPADNCDTCGLPGHSNTLVMNFDPSVYPEDLTVRRAVLAVWSPDNPRALNDVQLRGRLGVGNEMQSLARQREGMLPASGRSAEGWIFFDVTNFAARAINERRNSIHFELSVPCQTPADNLVTVGVTEKEPHLVIEYF